MTTPNDAASQRRDAPRTPTVLRFAARALVLAGVVAVCLLVLRYRDRLHDAAAPGELLSDRAPTASPTTEIRP